jgi:hypothetical protein
VQQHKAYQVALAGLSQLRLLDGLSHACKSPLVTIPDAGLLRDGATLWHSDDAGEASAEKQLLAGTSMLRGNRCRTT